MFSWNRPVLESISAILGRLPHALLIHGAPGIGKRALAEHVARLILCESPASPTDPCGQCGPCRWALAGNHPDLRRVEPESMAVPAAAEEGARPDKTARPSTEIKVDQIRELSDFLNVGSHRGGRRVAIVDPADAMNPHAANSLLKSLEEPSPSVVFLLVSHRPARLLPTIRSRCVAVPVPMPEPAVALRWLTEQGVAEAELWLAFSGGAPLLALDCAHSEKAQDVARMLDCLKRGDLDGLAASVSDRDGMEALADTMQKFALDRAFVASGAAARFGTSADSWAGKFPVRHWLAVARRLGRDHALARHPLNPRLFAGELVERVKGGA
jgi:DNA polymerase-3 subunit delta'